MGVKSYGGLDIDEVAFGTKYGVDDFGSAECLATVRDLVVSTGGFTSIPTDLSIISNGLGIKVSSDLFPQETLAEIKSARIQESGRYYGVDGLIDAVCLKNVDGKMTEIIFQAGLLVEQKRWAWAHELGHAMASWHQPVNGCGGFLSHPSFESEAELIAGELLFQGYEFNRVSATKRNCLATPLELRKIWKTPRVKTVSRYVTHGNVPRAVLIIPNSRPGCGEPDTICRTSISFDQTIVLTVRLAN
jgi:hypothetical protein